VKDTEMQLLTIAVVRNSESQKRHTSTSKHQEHQGNKHCHTNGPQHYVIQELQALGVAGCHCVNSFKAIYQCLHRHNSSLKHTVTDSAMIISKWFTPEMGCLDPGEKV
jgi:hypothetical protein